MDAVTIYPADECTHQHTGWCVALDSFVNVMDVGGCDCGYAGTLLTWLTPPASGGHDVCFRPKADILTLGKSHLGSHFLLEPYAVMRTSCREVLI
jgi:hypothetical protein